MARPTRNGGAEIPPDALAAITRLYEEGRYVQACARTAVLPPVAEWQGTAARLIGGRLANNVGAPRLAHWLHLQAWRNDRGSAEAAYYFSGSLLHSRGPFAVWKFLRRLPEFPDAPPARRADLLTLRARVAGIFRDFDTAAALFDEAARLDADRPWFWVEKGWFHERQDAYEAALEASRRALALHPHFRPAVQGAAHQLQLLGRDDEALELLRNALTHLESPAVAGQLATLESELHLYREALASWESVRTLSPWIEPRVLEWWEARMSDARYFAGDLAGASGHAARAGGSFYKDLAERLLAPPAEARRVLLPVGFVRQHHLTCAPATLSALARFWKVDVDHLALAAAICYDGTPDHVERHWAEENGWIAHEFRVTWEILVALLDRGVPFTLGTVETQSAHLQAVIGYDSFRGTLLIRDPYERTHGEFLASEFLERYAPSGPRGMLLLPAAEAPRLAGLELPDAPLYDHYYRLQRALHCYDRAEAQRHFDALETADAAHRLAAQAKRSLAWYDGSLPMQLAAVEELLVRYPKNGNFLWSKLNALRELTRRADYHDFLRQLATGRDAEPLFLREWAGELCQDARRHDEARRYLHAALRQRPTDPDNLHALANLHWNRRDFAEATALYRLAATSRDKVEFYSRSYFLAARHLRQADAALALFQRRFELSGRKSSQPVKVLFWALTTLDRHPEAFAQLEAALALRPDDGELLLFAADAFARHGDTARGDHLLGAAEKRSPRTAWLRTSAKVADYRCDLREALRAWQEVLAEEPLAMDAQRAVARLLAETEGRAAALQHLRGACDRFDHHIGLHELWADWARGEENEALEPVLQRLLALHPENAWAHRELALLHAAQRRPEDAARELAIAAQLEPQEPATPWARARVAAIAGRLAEARDACREALRLSIDHDASIRELLAASPTFEEKRAAVAFIRDELIRQVVFGDGLLAYREAAFDVTEPAELLTSLREALAARPDLWHAWSAVVLQLVDMQQFDEALALATQATERFPLLPRLWLDLAQVHQARRERDAEITPLRRALQLAPAWGQASRLLAGVHERMGNYEESARVLEQAVAAAPLDAYNHGCLADALWHLGRREEALQRLEHALRLEPGYSWAWDALRSWSPEKGAGNRAVILARELAKLRAGEPRSWYFLAQSLAGAPLEEKLAALDRAIELNPRYVDAHDFRAQLLAEAGRFEDALAACRPAAFSGELPDSLRGRAAWVEAQRGNVRAAITQMRTLVEASPDYYWGWNMLADWYAEDRDFERAREAAEKMARLAPRSAIPLGYLADIQRELGDQEGALATLRRAYQIDPTYAFAGFALLDDHLHKAEYAEAEDLVKLLQTHLPGARSLAAAARLHCRRDRREPALAALRELCFSAERDTAALLAANEAILKAHWARDAERVYFECLAEDGVNPEVGALWVRRFVARGAWKYRRRLYELETSRATGRRARIAYLEECGERRLSRHLNRLVERERPWLRSDDAAWGTVGYAYARMARYREAARWLEDWRKRTAIEPWMLLNVVTALRELGRDEEALEASRVALALPPDHSSPQHQLWLGLDAALAEDVAAARHSLSEIRVHDLGDYDKALFHLVRAVLTVVTAPAGERAAFLRQERHRLAREHGRELEDFALRRAYRQALRTMGRAADQHPFWLWLQTWSPASIAPRWRMAAVWFAFMGMFFALRTCDAPLRSSTARPAFTPPPIPARTPLDDPLALQPARPVAAPPAATPARALMPAADQSFSFDLDPEERMKAPPLLPEVR